jgi:hypothetical protein
MAEQHICFTTSVFWKKNTHKPLRRALFIMYGVVYFTTKGDLDVVCVTTKLVKQIHLSLQFDLLQKSIFNFDHQLN